MPVSPVNPLLQPKGQARSAAVVAKLPPATPAAAVPPVSPRHRLDQEGTLVRHGGTSMPWGSSSSGVTWQRLDLGAIRVQPCHRRQPRLRLPGVRPQELVPGRYMVAREEGDTFKGAPNWETGTVHFDNPLVMPWGGGYSEPTNWKNVLAARYGKAGRALTQALLADEYDGVITVGEYGTSEIVDLRGLPAGGGLKKGVACVKRVVRTIWNGVPPKKGKSCPRQSRSIGASIPKETVLPWTTTPTAIGSPRYIGMP
jgi:hypothetical protein